MDKDMNPGTAGDAFDEVVPIDLAEVAGAAQEKPARERFAVVNLADFDVGKGRGYIIKTLVAPGDVAILFGPPGAGKSVIAPYLAHAVGAGREVFGRRVRQVPVLYVAAEDGRGLEMRAVALRGAYGPSPGFNAIFDAPDLLDPKHMVRIQDAARSVGAGLIVLDTLARAFAGLDENDARSMGLAVRALRDLTEPTGAAVIAVHHGAKDKGATPRGHGVLNGDADVTLRIEVPDDAHDPTRVVHFGKNRNGPTHHVIAFNIRAETLGMDEDGDAITAPIAEETDPPEKVPKPVPIGANEALVLQAYHRLGGGRLKVAALIADAANHMPPPTGSGRDRRRDVATRALNSLGAKCRLFVVGNHVADREPDARAGGAS
jgi:hypothetical protein